MSLVIICGSLEPGADGVGDYSRLLAASCCNLGVPTHLLALNDPSVNAPESQHQQSGGLQLNVLRLPAGLSWDRRLTLADQQLQSWDCEAISLQFVPYAFEAGGLPTPLPAVIEALMHPMASGQARRPLHLMFHELWIGLTRTSSLRSRLIGRWQRRLIQRLYQGCSPCLVHTSNDAYRLCLSRIGIPAIRLPLFSNIPVVPAAPELRRPDRYTACVFGRIPPEWDPEPVVEALVSEAKRRHCRPFLRSLGRSHRSDDWLGAVRRRWPILNVDQQGPVACEDRLAQLIQSSDLGLATTPWPLVEKSGAVAAFLAMELPVVVSRNDWQLRRRWGNGRTPALTPHSNLFPLSYLGRSLNFPQYEPTTPQQVAARVLEGIGLRCVS